MTDEHVTRGSEYHAINPADSAEAFRLDYAVAELRKGSLRVEIWEGGDGNVILRVPGKTPCKMSTDIWEILPALRGLTEALEEIYGKWYDA